MALGAFLWPVIFPCKVDALDQHKSWQQYGGGPDQSKYVDFTQINKSNLNQLEIAWIHPASGAGMFNPIVVKGVMYVLSDDSTLSALDAATGREIWTRSNLSGIVRTGINYWESKDGKDRRLIICIRETLVGSCKPLEVH